LVLLITKGFQLLRVEGLQLRDGNADFFLWKSRSATTYDC
jgi:hypothetical protein